MTPQIPDRVIYEGETYFTYSDAFSQYLHSIKPKTRPQFTESSSANHSGYIVHYEVKDDKLYMVELEGNLLITEGKKTYDQEVGLDYIFPGQKEVFAEWFTGDLNLTPPDKFNWSYHKKEEEPNSLYLYVEKGVLVYAGMLNKKVIDRISKLKWELFDLKHRKKRTIWWYVGRKLFHRWVFFDDDSYY